MSLMFPDFSKYAARNALIRRLGLGADYAGYRESPLWHTIRARVVRKGTKCRCCSRLASQVHHKNYAEKTLLGLDLSGLVPICKKCHERIEFERGENCTLQQANARLQSRIERCDGRQARRQAKRKHKAPRVAVIVLAAPTKPRRPKRAKKRKSGVWPLPAREKNSTKKSLLGGPYKPGKATRICNKCNCYRVGLDGRGWCKQCRSRYAADGSATSLTLDGARRPALNHASVEA